MITQAVGALFNACWQGLAIVAVTSVALRFFQRSSAATRYAIWFAALVVIAALPIVDFGLARIVPAPVAASVQPTRFTVVQTGVVSYSYAKPLASHRVANVPTPTTTIGYAVEQPLDALAQLRILAAATTARIGEALSAAATPILLAWFFFSAVMLYRLGFAYARLRRVKRGLTPLVDARVDRLIANSKRPVVVGIASDLTMPCVLGFAKPAIALPSNLAAELSHEDLERIVRHEHAHVRRWDDVANAVQLVVEAVMCLNPAVHLVGRSLNVEREIACDDFAVEPLAERVQYAKCLTHIAVNGFGRARALPAPGFFFNRKQLLVRVERLLERGHNGSTTIAVAARYALVALALVAIAVARVQLPVIAAPVAPGVSVAPATNVVPTFMVGQPQIPTPMVGHAKITPAGPAHSVVPTFMVGHAKITPAGPSHSVGPAHSVVPTFMVGHAKMALHAMVAADRLALAAPARALAIASTVTKVSVAAPAFVRLHLHLHSLARTIAFSPSTNVATAVSNALAGQVVALAPAMPAPHIGNASGADFLDALSAAGYRNLSVDDLVRLKNVGVDGGLIDAAVRYNGARPSVETLVRMASVGVDADYLNNLQASGYPRMGLEDVVRIRAIGVDPIYIRDMIAALHTKPTIEQLTQLRALGVDADYVRSLAQLGYDKLTTEDLTRLRAVGVDADYIRLLRSKGIGGNGLSVDDLIRMKSAGVE
jgi:beta-lactamase regulating signal transducer with metallopeptidase domain